MTDYLPCLFSMVVVLERMVGSIEVLSLGLPAQIPRDSDSNCVWVRGFCFKRQKIPSFNSLIV